MPSASKSPSNEGRIGARFGIGYPFGGQRNRSARRQVITIGIAGRVVKAVALTRTGAVGIETIDEAIAIVVEAVGAILHRLAMEKQGKKYEKAKT
jgi:hypothetical protein